MAVPPPSAPANAQPNSAYPAPYVPPPSVPANVQPNPGYPYQNFMAAPPPRAPPNHAYPYNPFQQFADPLHEGGDAAFNGNVPVAINIAPNLPPVSHVAAVRIGWSLLAVLVGVLSCILAQVVRSTSSNDNAYYFTIGAIFVIYLPQWNQVRAPSMMFPAPKETQYFPIGECGWSNTVSNARWV